MAILGILAGIITVAVLYPVMFSDKDDFTECMGDFFDFNFFNDPDMFWDQIKIYVWLGSGVIIGLGVYHI